MASNSDYKKKKNLPWCQYYPCVVYFTCSWWPFYLCVYCIDVYIYVCSLCTVSMHANCWSPWINIYSMPRSVVINRTPAREILLSLSLESPAAAQPGVRWSSDRDASFTHVCPACAVRSQECVCDLSVRGRLGRSQEHPPLPHPFPTMPKD